MVLSVKRFMPCATMRCISSSGSQAMIALPSEVACGASILPMRPEFDAHGVARFAPRHGDDLVALQGGDMHGLAGRGVDRLEIRLRPARQVDLQAGMAEIENARAQGVEPPARHLGGKAALDQGRRADDGRWRC